MSDAASPIESIFEDAIHLVDPAERAAFLTRACQGDQSLRARVDALLDAHEKAGSFLATRGGMDAAPDSLIDETVARDPAPRSTLRRVAEDSATDTPGAVIGNYKLLQRIGEGGFGVVWMADQEKPVRRRVALKIIKAGMDTRQVIARFEQERQALAMMDHPNIAKVLDAGATLSGRPYFVMELVRGVKITEYCDQQGLAPRERIDLFITVCHAVQHAHQKGIIHRDLKPSNILVTVNDGEAVPKVIDFGVAKATQGRLTEGTLFTQFEQMIGTPLYMSPEQAEITSLDVDTRSDIYSLGVLLYELLTGRTPIDMATMARAGMDELRRLIREVDPPKPSARLRTLDGQELTTVAKRYHTEPAKLGGLLRGDIDWIVMKCLEKDRKRRYDTATGLAADLQRHLANEVVMARPPTTAYLLSKLIRRNKAACAAGAAIMLTLLVGIAASLWQAVRADREATRARTAESRAVATLAELSATAPAFAEQAHALAAREQFGEAIEKLDYALKLRPDGAEYLVAKADLLQCQLKLADAAAIYRQALRVKPGLARAADSAAVCDELLAAPPGKDGKLTRESLARLNVEMQKQQRPAAELMPVARLLGEEKKLVIDYWLERLKDLPVSAERPLKDRLTVRDDGRLALDLRDTKVIDLSPLAGAPLAVLNLSASKGQSELTDLSPLRGLDLIELNVRATNVADITPLREMHTLEKLDVSMTKVKKLSALGALRLRSLAFSGCGVRDLKPIRNMPLEEISLRGTRVTDLSPLIGMPIKAIDLTDVPVTDFSPLARLPLEKCYMQHNRITDLSVLRGLPLKELALWGCDNARNYAALAEIKTLELLLLPSGYRTLPADDYDAIAGLRSLPNLRQLDSEIMDRMGYEATGSSDLFWKAWDVEQTFVPALRKAGVTFFLTRLPAGTYALLIQNQPLRDLSFLKGAPISFLDITGTPISDLTPIHDSPLETLVATNDTITDLAPLRGMPLKKLYLQAPGVSDLSPLAKLPLKSLIVDACPNVTDVAPLAEISTLELLTVPMQARNIDSLRKLPNLKRLGVGHNGTELPDTTVAEFWKQYEWISRLYKAGLKPEMSRGKDGTWSVNLNNSAISDLTMLEGAPISELLLGNTAVSDLTPLKKSPLKHLWIYNTKVTDLSPLKGMRLEVLQINSTPVTDISVLRGMPLTLLRLHDCQDLTDVSPLADAKELQTLTLPRMARSFDFLHAFPKLTHIGFKEVKGNPDRTAAAFWKENDLDWAKALRQAGVEPKATQELPDGTWDLNLSDSTISDLTLLKGAHISNLAIEHTAVTDLSPLRGMAIKKLWMKGVKVTDLTPLQGMPLQYLRLSGRGLTDLSAIRGLPLTDLQLSGGLDLKDISALRGMPLKNLRLHECAVLSDLSPLADVKTLKSLTLPPIATDIEFLRKHPALERISFKAGDPKRGAPPDKTVAEFWKEYDAKQR